MSFNWAVKVVDGHNHKELSNSLNYLDKDKPTLIIANTTKGKGVSFMENNVSWHYKSPSDKDIFKAVGEIN